MTYTEVALSKYGTVKTCKIVRNVVTIVVTHGFNENAKTVFSFLQECSTLFPNHTTVETLITEENLAIVVLTTPET